MGILMWNYISKSTLKREFASFLTGWLLGMATYLILTAPTWDQAYRLLSDFTLPVLGFSLAAFGADYLAKQTNIAGPPQQDGFPPRDPPQDGPERLPPS